MAVASPPASRVGIKTADKLVNALFFTAAAAANAFCILKKLLKAEEGGATMFSVPTPGFAEDIWNKL